MSRDVKSNPVTDNWHHSAAAAATAANVDVSAIGIRCFTARRTAKSIDSSSKAPAFDEDFVAAAGMGGQRPPRMCVCVRVRAHARVWLALSAAVT
jgi:hypothetical protein